MALHDPSAFEEGLGRGLAPPPAAREARRVRVAAALALVGGVAFAIAYVSRGPAATTMSRFGEEVTRLEADTSTVCDEYPYLKLDSVPYSNLGSQGPDGGQGEGMVLLTKVVGGGAPSEYGHKITVIVNVTDAPAGAFNPLHNVMSGEYWQIAVNSGYAVPVHVKFVETKTGKPLKVPRYAITFFDLDAAEGMASKESVIIGGYEHYKTTSRTEVRETAIGSEMRFAASTVGTYDDGPEDPHFLTQQQRNRAVSLLFHGTSEFRFTLSAGAGLGTRYFNMASRPSLYCAVTSQEGAAPPLADLQVHPPKQSPVISAYGETFVKFFVEEGDDVKKDDPLYMVTDRSGEERTYRAPADGAVVAVQEELRWGDLLDQRTTDHVIAVVERTTWEFDVWLVDVGDLVQEGDPICRLKAARGFGRKTVRASKTGTVERRQEYLQRGDPVDVASDAGFAVIGKIASVDTGMFERGAAAPGNAVFERWLAQDGECVRFMQPIADFFIPTRLADRKTQLLSPGSGTVSYRAPLKPGETVSLQLAGGPVAKVYMGPPWWFFLLCALVALCCVLYALFRVMKKPMPYTPVKPVHPAAEPPLPPPDLEPSEGLRLDFDESGTIHTVYAKYRPLGIKHCQLAPIIAHEFTVNSYAKTELKVREGWKLVRIGDEELHDSTDFAYVSRELAGHMPDLPLWPLPLTFKKPGEDKGAEELTVKFSERPLGLEFSNHAPIQLSKVYEDSPAHAAGIQVGWLLAAIGEYDVHANSDFLDVMRHIKEGVEALDDFGKKYN